MLRQNHVLVDLEAIAHNYRLQNECLPPHMQTMPVVKADAYGHGMIQVAKTVCDCGATALAVALVDEGMALRDGGIDTNVTILVLGATTQAGIKSAIEHHLTQTIFTVDMVHQINEMAKAMHETACVHIKLDTGMNRIGLKTEQEAKAVAGALQNASNVCATGVYTHFADADEPDDVHEMNAFTHQQWTCYQKLCAYFPKQLVHHVSNSAAALRYPEKSLDMIRQGISLYGYPPVKTKLAFRPALRWISEIVWIKDVEAGESIGYGCSYVAKQNMKIATVAVGYGDGYHRMASNQGQMLVHGIRANIVGRVCMDQTMIDVSAIGEASIGDEVVLIGNQGEDFISAQEVATWCSTISYEVLLSITARVPKIYLPLQG